MKCPLCHAENQAGAFCTSCGMRIGSADPTQTAMPTTPKTQGGGGPAPEVFLGLQQSETAVLHSASRIYAAYLASNQVTEANESALMSKSVRTAIQLAVIAEKLIQSDDEEW